MENLHSLLSRQLKKHGRSRPADELLLAIDAAYRQALDYFDSLDEATL